MAIHRRHVFHRQAVLTRHARERCAEMGISTKVAKEIVRHPDHTYPGRPGTETLVVRSDHQPDYFIVVPDSFPQDEEVVVITVCFNTPGMVHSREGKTCRIVRPA